MKQKFVLLKVTTPEMWQNLHLIKWILTQGVRCVVQMVYFEKLQFSFLF